MKHIFILLLLLGMFFSAGAGENYLIMQSKDGSSYAFALRNRVSMRFADDTVTLSSEIGDRVFSFGAVQGFVYEDTEDMSVVSTSVALSISPNPTSDMLFLNHVSAASVRLYSLRGKLLRKKKVENETAELNIADLPDGIYLLRLDDGLSFEIIKK